MPGRAIPLIAALDGSLPGEGATHDNFSGEAGRFKLIFHVYGRDGVMGSRNHSRALDTVGIVIEAVAETPDLAEAILGFARSTMLHYGFPGRFPPPATSLSLFSFWLQGGELCIFGLSFDDR